MSNWGQAIVKAKKRNKLANVNPDPDWSSHDVLASDMRSMSLSSNIDTFSNIQFIVDQATDHTVAMPSSHPIYVDNYVEGTTGTSNLTTPNVKWVIPTGSPSTVISEYAMTPPPSGGGGSGGGGGGGGSGAMATTPSTETSTSVTNGLTKIFTSAVEQKPPTEYNSTYRGSQFATSYISRTVADKAISNGTHLIGGSFSLNGDPVLQTRRSVAEQRTVAQDIWWCLETDGISGDANVGFLLELNFRDKNANKQPSGVVIRINRGGGEMGSGSPPENQWDIVCVEGSSPYIVDWKLGSNKIQTTTLPSLRWDSRNEVVVMPIPGAGKLLITINGEQHVYSRPNISVDDGAAPDAPAVGAAGAATGGAGSGNGGGGGGSGGTGSDGDFGLEPFKFKVDTLRVAGTNSTAIIAVHAIGFAYGYCMSGLVAGAGNNQWTTDLQSTIDGVTGGAAEPVVVPMEGVGNTGTGIVSSMHDGIATDGVMDDIEAYHGLAKIAKVSSAATPGMNYYRIEMAAEKGTFGSTRTPLPIRPPAFYRAKGINEKPAPNDDVGTGTEISDDIISLNENFHSPDRACIEHSIELTLYNENAKHNDLLEKGLGIVIKLGWKRVRETVFTGVSLGGYRSEVAGKETLTIHCEDYMRVLQDTLMINSPFYDGMEIYDAVWDMAKRAGLASPQNDTRGSYYFIPCGYSFTEPKLRYAGDSNCKDNIVDLCRRSERVVYFDGDGILHLDNLQGSLAFTTSATSVAEFFSDPNVTDDDMKVILDDMRRESKLDSTVNGIVIKTSDRLNGNIILLSDKASNSAILYRKKILMQQPALGSYRNANEFMEMLAHRVYKPIKGITIKTMSDQTILPMSFINVNGEQFRVMKFSRQFDAAENSLTTSISGEFMGA